ncbi:MAG: hypothetical protein AAF944_11345 [Bacteroidota bacterium]
MHHSFFYSVDQQSVGKAGALGAILVEPLDLLPQRIGLLDSPQQYLVLMIGIIPQAPLKLPVVAVQVLLVFGGLLFGDDGFHSRNLYI